ncbi:MAG: hypothetical protein ABID38_02035 [Candidatus Diapherotrites archaeon]
MALSNEELDVAKGRIRQEIWNMGTNLNPETIESEFQKERVNFSGAELKAFDHWFLTEIRNKDIAQHQARRRDEANTAKMSEAPEAEPAETKLKERSLTPDERGRLIKYLRGERKILKGQPNIRFVSAANVFLERNMNIKTPRGKQHAELLEIVKHARKGFVGFHATRALNWTKGRFARRVK